MADPGEVNGSRLAGADPGICGASGAPALGARAAGAEGAWARAGCAGAGSGSFPVASAGRLGATEPGCVLPPSLSGREAVDTCLSSSAAVASSCKDGYRIAGKNIEFNLISTSQQGKSILNEDPRRGFPPNV